MKKSAEILLKCRSLRWQILPDAQPCMNSTWWIDKWSMNVNWNVIGKIQLTVQDASAGLHWISGTYSELSDDYAYNFPLNSLSHTVNWVLGTWCLLLLFASGQILFNMWCTCEVVIMSKLWHINRWLDIAILRLFSLERNLNFGCFVHWMICSSVVSFHR